MKSLYLTKYARLDMITNLHHVTKYSRRNRSNTGRDRRASNLNRNLAVSTEIAIYIFSYT